MAVPALCFAKNRCAGIRLNATDTRVNKRAEILRSAREGIA
ncbi:hypothetical protein FIU90_05560 [Erythrobacter sp. THAF29]|nr:hypothetical protein FIU90_05560 [Erythrobacter sp. THAF29]